MLFNSFAAAGD